MKILIDLECKSCGWEKLDHWADDDCRKMVSEGRLHCDDCLASLTIKLGAPQFSIHGAGVHDSGKH